MEQEAEGIRVTIEYRMELPLGEDGQEIQDNMAYGTIQFLNNLKSVYEAGQDQRTLMWTTWLGIRHTTVLESSDQSNVQGTKVTYVKESSAAGLVGVQLGDIIFKVNNREIRCYDDLEEATTKGTVGDKVKLHIWRVGESQVVDCVVAPYPVPYSTNIKV